MTSFISSSKSSDKSDNDAFSKPLRILVLAALLVVVVEVVTRGFSDNGGSSGGKADLLTVQPEEDGIYLLGNSMFKTGIDVQLLDNSLPNDLVDFEYHNGHYTNLWYLIAKSALPDIQEVPSVIVWGYRPRYALDPAFRQNRLNATDLFAIDDPLYNSLSSSGEVIPEEKGVHAWLNESSIYYEHRDQIADKVKEYQTRLGLKILDALNIGSTSSLEVALLKNGRSIADEVLRSVTKGQVNLTEETVVDAQGDFITGPFKSFNEGYIPRTAEAIADLGIPQVVIIWRPVAAATGELSNAEINFVSDSLEYFAENAIPVLNLFDDEEIGIDFFASGDHYNAAGREYITLKLANFLKEQGLSQTFLLPEELNLQNSQELEEETTLLPNGVDGGSSGGKADLLTVQPEEDGIYLLGNSMFKTGIDVQLLDNSLPNDLVDFEYHNGHYTNLWYLIAKSALPDIQEVPSVIVWGYRPRYALDPAFRQNRLNATDLFAIDDPLYNSLSSSGEVIPEEKGVHAWLNESSIYYEHRDQIADKVKEYQTRLGLKILDALNIGSTSSLEVALLKNGRSIADEVLRSVTKGQVNLTEETVVDAQGDFITGPFKSFNEGYIPRTAEAIADLGIPQVVIIWRPVAAATGELSNAEINFVSDSLEYFAENAIPVLNLFDDEEIGIDFFASGDHYNAAGREYITLKLANFLQITLS